MCYHDLIPWVPDLPVAGCVHTPSRLSRWSRFSRLRFSLFTENSENRSPRQSSRIPRLRDAPAVRHGFFLPIFSFCAQKTAQARRARRRTEKFHDEKAYFRKTSCQNRGNVISYRQGAGHPVVGCVHTLLVCRAGHTAGRLLFYNIILA